jgi:hypothetical protein
MVLVLACSCGTHDMVADRVPRAIGPAPVEANTAPFEGLDLKRLEHGGDPALMPLFEGRIPLEFRDTRNHYWYEPWHRWQTTAGGGASRTILLAGSRIDPHPGSTKLRFGVLDGAGNVLSVTDFTTGHRTYLRRARLLTVPYVDEPVLVMETQEICGRRATDILQYYVLLDDVPVLVRLEDADRRAVRNGYSHPHFVSGPPVPMRSRDEWLDALSAKDTRRALAALVWFGGTHNRDNRRLRDLRADPDIRSALTALATSENGWVAEGARLALKPEYYASGP